MYRERSEMPQSKTNPGCYGPKSSSTVLRNHLTRCHLETYLAACERNGWTERAKSAKATHYSTSDIAVKPKYSKEALLKALIAFIVADDQVRDCARF